MCVCFTESLLGDMLWCGLSRVQYTDSWCRITTVRMDSCVCLSSSTNIFSLPLRLLQQLSQGMFSSTLNSPFVKLTTVTTLKVVFVLLTCNTSMRDDRHIYWAWFWNFTTIAFGELNNYWDYRSTFFILFFATVSILFCNKRYSYAYDCTVEDVFPVKAYGQLVSVQK